MDRKKNLSGEEMKQITFFLGAGASYYYGYKTFYGFPDLIFAEIEKQNIDRNIKKVFDNIIDILHTNNAPTTHDNILWKLCDYKDLSHLMRKDKYVKDKFINSTLSWATYKDFSEIIQECLYLVNKITIDHYGENRIIDDKNEKGKELVRFFNNISDINGNGIDIYTTNYDCLFEDINSEIGFEKLHFVNGITKESIWDKKEYKNNKEALLYYRLHGCVNWYYKEFGNETIYYKNDDTLSVNMIKQSCAMYPSREQYKGKEPYIYAYESFFNAVKNANIIVFVGFSFRDKDVNQILLNAAKNRESKNKTSNN